MNPSPLLSQIDIGGVWRITIFFGIAFSIIKWVSGSDVAPLSAKLLWSYTLVSALFILEFPLVQFGEVHTAFQATAGQALIEAIFIPIGAIVFRKLIPKLLPYVVSFALLCVWMNWPGFLHAPSFHSAFAALAIPLLVSPYLIGAVVITVLTHHGTTALLILSAQMLALTLRLKKRRLLIFLVAFALSAYFCRAGGPLLNGEERLTKYAEFMGFWAREWRWIILGVGPGSFMWTSLMLDKFQTPLFLQMHSDWLQIVWELGLVGFALTVGVFLSAIKSAWDKPRLLAAIAGCAAFGLTYHPLRFYPPALLIAYIFILAFSCKTSSLQARRSSSFR